MNHLNKIKLKVARNLNFPLRILFNLANTGRYVMFKTNGELLLSLEDFSLFKRSSLKFSGS